MARVCIVGCGPIGLSSALLLAQQGIRTLLLERRSSLSTHPRSRFVDVNTMEIMRSLGIEKEIEGTGLGPDWTAFNRWSVSLVSQNCTSIASPSFHTVPNAVSPCLPVMTCQDYVEAELLKQVRQTDLIDCRFETEAREIEQSIQQGSEAVTLSICHLKSGQQEQIQVDYLIGADGPHSKIRDLIGSELQASPLPMYSQDVIFQADLSAQVGARKGALLYSATAQGILVFQPLDGVLRWRCQIFKPQAEDLSKEQIVERIKLAVGDASIALELTSIGHWQPTPGCTTKLREGRIFLVGDAAHVSLPTGGMGNNIGFAGARNLAWKLACVLRGQAEAEILDTYELEMKPVALKRIAHGVDTTDGMRELFMAILSGGDRRKGQRATSRYADYDGIILGHEMQSALIAPDVSTPPEVKDPVVDFVPVVRSGRRAPHIWLDEGRQQSVCDWFSHRYVLITGYGVNAASWQKAVDRLATRFPIVLRALPVLENSAIYAHDALVLVRPDGVVADHWRVQDVAPGQEWNRLVEFLPLKDAT
ncbi:MAG: FAD-dependent monooxygenase [Gammaproteobacteria bacterium]